jgi:O-succinylhomoserine sulfhydrylase|tara:strand:- start:9077 stop:10267 length:1191 start_codon:yes stop_codon:yes gene_type:complete
MRGKTENARFSTLAIRAGFDPSHHREHSEAIYTTSSFTFDTAEQAAEVFSGDEAGNVYSRYTNPSVRVFEERLAALEGGEDAVATASGMSAILALCLSVMRTGDHVVCSRDVFGSSLGLFANTLSRLDIQCSFVSLRDLDAWEQAIQPNTRLLFCETPSNPLSEIANLSALSDLAKAGGAVFAVDNCFCTPALQKPMAFGADVVIHSATKYLDGQGRVLGGALVGRKDLMEEARSFVRVCGPSMSPFNAWIFTKGLETLELRMRAHCENAQALATWLQEQTPVTNIFYSGLADHSDHALASKQQSGFGGVLAFELAGGQEQAFRFINATELMSLTANLGDVKTTITHPATTTHCRLSAEQKQSSGISSSLIRIAVGLEHIDDLMEDCSRGLRALST